MVAARVGRRQDTSDARGRGARGAPRAGASTGGAARATAWVHVEVRSERGAGDISFRRDVMPESALFRVGVIDGYRSSHHPSRPLPDRARERHARAPRCGARRGRGGVRARARARAPPRVLGGWRHRLVAPAGCAHARVGTLAPLVCGVTVLAVPAVPAVPASPRWLHRGFAGSVVPPPSDPSPPPPADRLPARSVPASPAPWSFADVATVPNSLSVARGLAGPALACAVLHDAHPAFVLAGVFAAAVSDWLDGHLARRWNQRSVAGTYLDPRATRSSSASLAIALAVGGRRSRVARRVSRRTRRRARRRIALPTRASARMAMEHLGGVRGRRRRQPRAREASAARAADAREDQHGGAVRALRRCAGASGGRVAHGGDDGDGTRRGRRDDGGVGGRVPLRLIRRLRQSRETNAKRRGRGRGRGRSRGDERAGMENVSRGRRRKRGAIDPVAWRPRGGGGGGPTLIDAESGGCVVTRDAHAGSNPLGSEL